MRAHIVVTGCAGSIGSHLTDRLLADGRTVVGIASFEDYPRPLKEAKLEGALANPAFALHEANNLDLAAEAAPGGPEAGGGSGSALAALLFGGWACAYRLTVGVPDVVSASCSSEYGGHDGPPLREAVTPRWT